jgi:hypothetical protein
MERDEFLTEKMKECCRQYNIKQNSFSTWEGFGKLLTSLSGLGLSKFVIEQSLHFAFPPDNDFPDRFATIIANLLGWKKGT